MATLRSDWGNVKRWVMLWLVAGAYGCGGGGGPDNVAPAIQPLEASTTQDTAVIIDVAGASSDADGSVDPGSVRVATAPASGMAQVNGDGTVTYTPEPGFVCEERFRVTIRDNRGAESAAAAVTVSSVRGPWLRPSTLPPGAR